MLTDDECNEFRRLNMSFNDMVRAIYDAGRQSAFRDTAADMYYQIIPDASNSGADAQLIMYKLFKV